MAGMTRLELANQLIEGQPAFHFEFIPMNWYRWRDSNPHYLVSKTSASFQLGYTGKNLAEATGVEPAHAMRGDLADRCHTIRRRLRELAEGTGVEPASDERGSFRDYCLTS